MGYISALSAAFISLCGRKLALAGLQRANLSGQSPVVKFQYPNLFAGDAVRDSGDRFDSLQLVASQSSLHGSPCSIA
jgi:hypothetical protein